MPKYVLLDNNNRVNTIVESEVEQPAPYQLAPDNIDIGFSYDSATDTYTDPVANQPVLVITTVKNTADNSTIALDGTILPIAVGTETEITAEIQDGNGNPLPVNKSFLLPIAGLHGTPARTKLINVANGVGVCTIPWPSAGLWQVTQEMVNADISDIAQQFKFAGLKIKVYE